MLSFMDVSIHIFIFSDQDFWSTVTSLAGDEEKAAVLPDDDDPQVNFPTVALSFPR